MSKHYFWQWNEFDVEESQQSQRRNASSTSSTPTGTRVPTSQSNRQEDPREEYQHEAAASITEWRSLHEEGPPHVITLLRKPPAIVGKLISLVVSPSVIMFLLMVFGSIGVIMSLFVKYVDEKCSMKWGCLKTRHVYEALRPNGWNYTVIKYNITLFLVSLIIRMIKKFSLRPPL